jgi:hypothetical protein
MALNLLASIDAFRQGREDARRSALAELAERGRKLAGMYLQTGDKNYLSQLAAADPRLGIQFMQHNDAREDRAADRAFRQSESERSQRNADRSYQLDIQQFGQTVANQNWARRLEQDRLALERDKIVREDQKSAGKAPEVVELYDSEGRATKAVWNPQTRQFETIGGAKAKDKTVDQAKGEAILQGAEGSFAPAQANFKELGNWQNTLATATDILPFGLSRSLPRAFMSEKGQVGQDAVRNIVSNYIYALSGAQAPETEVQRNMALVMPSVTDSPETITAKHSRLQDMINTLRTRAGQPAGSAGADGWNDAGNGIRIRKKQ